MSGAPGPEGRHGSRLRHEDPQEGGHGGESAKKKQTKKADIFLGNHALIKCFFFLYLGANSSRESREGRPGRGGPPVDSQDVLLLPGTTS